MTCEELDDLKKRPLLQCTLAERTAARAHVGSCRKCACEVLAGVATRIADGSFNAKQFNAGRALCAADDLRNDPEARLDEGRS